MSHENDLFQFAKNFCPRSYSIVEMTQKSAHKYHNSGCILLKE